MSVNLFLFRIFHSFLLECCTSNLGAMIKIVGEKWTVRIHEGLWFSSERNLGVWCYLQLSRCCPWYWQQHSSLSLSLLSSQLSQPVFPSFALKVFSWCDYLLMFVSRLSQCCLVNLSLHLMLHAPLFLCQLVFPCSPDYHLQSLHPSVLWTLLMFWWGFLEDLLTLC